MEYGTLLVREESGPAEVAVTSEQRSARLGRKPSRQEHPTRGCWACGKKEASETKNGNSNADIQPNMGYIWEY